MPISLQDLTTAAGVLRKAKALVETVRDLFRGNDTIIAARLNGSMMSRTNLPRTLPEMMIVNV